MFTFKHSDLPSHSTKNNFREIFRKIENIDCNKYYSLIEEINDDDSANARLSSVVFKALRFNRNDFFSQSNLSGLIPASLFKINNLLWANIKNNDELKELFKALQILFFVISIASFAVLKASM